MKELALLFFSLLFTLASYVGCTLFPRYRYVLVVLALVSLAQVDTFDFNFFSHENYRQATRGLEFHLVDFCALALGFDLLTRGKATWRIPLLRTWLLYFLFALLSWTMIEGSRPNPFVNDPEWGLYLGQEPTFALRLYPLFELAKILRGLFLYWVIANLAKEEAFLRTIKWTSLALVVFLAMRALCDRYLFGVHRVSPGFNHTNDFNTFVAMLTAFLYPALFATPGILRTSFYMSAIMGGTLAVLLTVSRSSLAALGLALGGATPFLLLLFPQAKNWMVVGIISVGALALGGKAADTLWKRFSTTTEAEISSNIRDDYNARAQKMANDFPLGVGMGNWSAWSILRYAQEEGYDMGTFAHNMFYLTLGELGYGGLLLFIFYWIRATQTLFISATKSVLWGSPLQRSSTIGALLGIAVLAVQLFYHFTYRTTPTYLLTSILLGCSAGVRLSLKRSTVPAEASPAHV